MLLLLKKGAYTNVRDAKGQIVLQLALRKGGADIVRLLLNYSAIVIANPHFERLRLVFPISIGKSI